MEEEEEEEEEEREYEGEIHFSLFDDYRGTFVTYFCTTRNLVGHESTRR